MKKELRRLRVPPPQTEDGRKLQELWMVPYADLMSMMVILFLGFYAYSQIQRQNPAYQKHLAELQYELAAEKNKKKMEKKVQEADLAKRMQEKLYLEQQALLILSSKKIQITLPAPVLFESGSVELKVGAETILDSIAEALKSVDNPVIVEGHTDNVPVGKNLPYTSNWELATLRAASVVRYFVSKGMDARRFSAWGFGEHRPVASNDTPEGRLKNRRIEIYVVRQGDQAM